MNGAAAVTKIEIPVVPDHWCGFDRCFDGILPFHLLRRAADRDETSSRITVTRVSANGNVYRDV